MKLGETPIGSMISLDNEVRFVCDHNNIFTRVMTASGKLWYDSPAKEVTVLLTPEETLGRSFKLAQEKMG